MKILASVLLVVSILFPSFIMVDQVTASAIDTSMIIFQVKTEGDTATDEYILLYNQSVNEVDLAGWCLSYSTAGDNPSIAFSEVCVASKFLVPAGEFVSFGTATFANSTGYGVDFSFSGGMNSSGGHLRLLDAAEQEKDKVGWGSAVNPEKVSSLVAPPKHLKDQTLSRNILSSEFDTNDNLIDFSSSSAIYQCPVTKMILSPAYYVDESGSCIKRFCPNLPDSTAEAPDGFYKPDGEENCEEIPVLLEDAVLFITELYPNAPGTDTGQEFIELYNPNETEVSLVGYKIQVGPGFTKDYVFTDGTIMPSEYQIFSDLFTDIVLPNSNGVELRLVAPDGKLVSETVVYSNAADDESWSLVEDQWIWTNQITPGSANRPFLVPAVDEEEGVTSILAPCPEGKFRNPETNRCKNLEIVVSNLTPCDEDEFRNPLTNRCNKVTSPSALTPCNPGQIRNPETNRCRAASSSTSGLEQCEEGKERNPETNRCRAVSVLGISDVSSGTVTDIPVQNTEGQINWFMIITALLATAGYMVYEWRSELRHKLLILKPSR